MLYVWHTSGITSLEQAKTREVVLGAVSVTSDSYIYPTEMNGRLGTKFRIVNGYTTGQALNLAVERGEVMGRGGTSWASIQSSRPTWMQDKAINIALGYSYWLPPGVPADRVAAPRAAFAATAADPALREEAAARKIIIRPQEGAALEALVRETAATPKPVIDKAVRLLGWK